MSNPLTGIACAIALFFAVAFGFQTVQLHYADAALKVANADLKAAKESLDAAITTAKTNHDAITDLAGRLTACVGENQRVQQAAESAAAQAARAQAQRNTALRQLSDARKKLYANDATCAAWGSAPVCGGVSGGLRELWNATRSADENGADRGTEAPVRAHPAQPVDGTAVARSSDAGPVR